MSTENNTFTAWAGVAKGKKEKKLQLIKGKEAR